MRTQETTTPSIGVPAARKGWHRCWVTRHVIYAAEGYQMVVDAKGRSVTAPSGTNDDGSLRLSYLMEISAAKHAAIVAQNDAAADAIADTIRPALAVSRRPLWDTRGDGPRTLAPGRWWLWQPKHWLWTVGIGWLRKPQFGLRVYWKFRNTHDAAELALWHAADDALLAEYRETYGDEG